MRPGDLIQVTDFEEYGLEQEDVEVMLDVMPMYGIVENKGQLGEQQDYHFSEDGILEDDEKPEQVGREGESSLGFAYDDFQYHLAGMIGEGSFNVKKEEQLNLPEYSQKEAAGALFGASYALFRNQVMEEGFPADHASFNQDIESDEERERFLEEGAYEIEGEVMGPWGYDHEMMNEVIDPDTALEVYNQVAEKLV